MDLKVARGHMMPPPLHVCNGLNRPVDESMLTWDIETAGHTTGQTADMVKQHSLC